jgi:hypothetical protein
VSTVTENIPVPVLVPAPVAFGPLAVTKPESLVVIPSASSATPLLIVEVVWQLLEDGVMNGADGVTVSPTV